MRRSARDQAVRRKASLGDVGGWREPVSAAFEERSMKLGFATAVVTAASLWRSITAGPSEAKLERDTRKTALRCRV
jgi:hypothetical protein